MPKARTPRAKAKPSGRATSTKRAATKKRVAIKKDVKVATLKRKGELAAFLTEQARTAFSRLRAEHGGERFYFFALFTTEEGSYVVPTAWSEEALATVVAKYRQTSTDGEDRLASDLRFSAADSPYHEAYADAFDDLRSGSGLHAACFVALETLDHEGLFGRGAEREKVIVNVVYGDMSDERWLEHAQRLNPPRAIANVRRYLRLHEPSGRTSAWGGGVYQVNAVSFSRDRQTLAYSGSGGDVGVYQWAKKPTPLFEKRRQGEHWASVLSPEGDRLYLGDRDGILVLDPKTGASRKLARTGRLSELALSARGDLLAAAGGEIPVTVFATDDGRVVMKRAKKGQARLSFSPGSDLLAIASEELAVIEATIDKPVASYRTGAEAWGGSVAWSPAGDLLVASSPRDGGIVLLGWPGLARKAAATLNAEAKGLSFSPSGRHVAACIGRELVIYDVNLTEVARGCGRQESLIASAFKSDRLAVAVGRDVNHGPAILVLEF